MPEDKLCPSFRQSRFRAEPDVKRCRKREMKETLYKTANYRKIQKKLKTSGKSGAFLQGFPNFPEINKKCINSMDSCYFFLYNSL